MRSNRANDLVQILPVSVRGKVVSSSDLGQPILEFRAALFLERRDYLDAHMFVLGYLLDNLPAVQVQAQLSRQSLGDGLTSATGFTTDRNHWPRSDRCRFLGVTPLVS